MNPTTLEWIITHLFLPPKLPQNADHEDPKNDLALCDLIAETATDFAHAQPRCSTALDPDLCWKPLIKMAKHLYDFQHALSTDSLEEALHAMCPGGESF